MDYCVELDIFRGPLDLLLYLVRRDELDILDIPIARVAEQYLAYLKILQMIDVDVAGDFLVMATTLMEIKSQLLLPKTQGDAPSEADPRMQLVKQLLEYKKFRDAAEILRELADEQLLRFTRVPMERFGQPADPTNQPIRDVELWDLVSAYGRMMRQTSAMAPRSIVYDETPIEVHMDQILSLLSGQGRISFWNLFGGPPDRGRVVGKFLAVLELFKSKKIRVDQNEPFGEIWLSASDAEAALAPESAGCTLVSPQAESSNEPRVSPQQVVL